MKKSTTIIISVLCAMTLATSCVGAVFGYSAWVRSGEKQEIEIDENVMDSINNLTELLSKANMEDVAQEDDVTIASTYVIRSTKQISDAYKSGETEELSDRDKETLDMASKILDEIVTDNMIDFEKELAVYEWLIHNVNFDNGSLLVIPETTADCDNPYGVLKYRSAVCVGYATTFRMFMQMMDIECMVVHNTGLGHSWDLVKLGDHWYHTDVYSDQYSSNYSNFNMNDTLCSAGHDWNRDFFPAADGYEFNYYYMNRIKKENVWDLPATVRGAIDENKKILGIEFSEEIDEHSAQIVEMIMQEIYNRYSGSDQLNYPELSWSWLDTGEKYILCCSISRNEWNEDTPDELTEEEYSRVYNEIDKAFEDVEIVYYDTEEWYDYN